MVNIQAYQEARPAPAQSKVLRDSLISERHELVDSITALNALIDAKQDRAIRDSGNVARVFRMLVTRLAKKRFATVPHEVRRRACVLAQHHKAMILEIDAALGRLDECQSRNAIVSRAA